MKMSKKEIFETYTTFIKQLMKTRCVYVGEDEFEPECLKRQEVLLSLVSSVSETLEKSRLEAFLRFMTSFGTTDVDEIFQKMESSSGCDAFFFFNKDSAANKLINVGRILRAQSTKVRTQLRNHVLVLFLLCCQYLHQKSGVPKEYKPLYDSFLEHLSEVESERSFDPAEFGDFVKNMQPNLSSFVSTAGGLDKLVGDLGGSVKETLGRLDPGELDRMLDAVKSAVASVDADSLKKTLENVDVSSLLKTLSLS